MCETCRSIYYTSITMIILFHILYWHVTKLLHQLTLNRLDKIQTEVVDDCLFHTEENKVTDTTASASADAEVGLTFDPPVYCQRYAAVQQILLNEKWRGQIGKIVDFGCAELSFFRYVKSLIGLREALFVDVDRTLLEFSGNKVEPFAADFLKRRKEPLHVQVLQGSIAYPDVKLLNTDGVICIEIIEHLYPDTLDAVPHNIFHFIEPRIAVFTTPNADFNVLFPNFSGRRHYDHKFEWTREQFEDWAYNITLRYPKYNVQFEGIGPGPAGTEHLGCCSQMAVFVHKYFNETHLDVERLIQYNVLGDTKDCKLCTLESWDILSHGVCTYASHNISKPAEPDREHCEHCHMQYKLVREVQYPYDNDTRSQDEIIQHESEFRMSSIANRSRMYYNSEKDLHEIPLYELTANRDGEFISIPDLRNVLEKAGWTVEDCNITDTLVVPCVIYSEHQLDSSELSQSPDLNFSTDVNWDSGSQWDAGSTTEIWDDAQSNMDTVTNNTKSSEPTKDTSTDLWETASSTNGHSTTATNTKSDTLPFETCLDGGGSPDSDGKVELLFDSGYQMSTSSVDISPENAKEFLSEEHKQTEDVMKKKNDTDAAKCYKDTSKSSIFIARKRGKAVLDDMPVQRVVIALVQAPPAVPEAEPVEVVENGDLANNNRDREGNNYQAAENDVQVQDDNARPRPLENLDEHNENHIVMQQQEVDPPGGEPGEDDDAAESLEDASREALYDPNSELSFSEDTYLGERMSFEEYHLPIVQENRQLFAVDDYQLLPRFPEWLLNIRVNEDDDGDLLRGDFYSQGDGVGIHPSMVELPRSADNSSSSSSTSTTLEDNAVHDTTPRSQDTLAGVDSSLDVTYQDALDHLSETNLDTEGAMGLNVMGLGVNVHDDGTE